MFQSIDFSLSSYSPYKFILIKYKYIYILEQDIYILEEDIY